MTKKGKRLKAQDVFKCDTLFGEKVSEFSKAFPDIASLRGMVEEFDFGSLERTMYYSESNIGEYINCGNPRCYNGGFQLGQQLRFMSYDKETKKKFNIHCQGYEGSPKGRKKYGPCDRHFKVEIEIVYKEEEKE